MASVAAPPHARFAPPPRAQMMDTTETGSAGGWFGWVWTFLAGVLTAFTVSIVGEMPVGEVLLFAAAGWALLVTAATRTWANPLWRNPLFLTLIVAQGVALAAYVFSDLYRGSWPMDMARGWARMVFLLVDIVAVVHLVGRSPANLVALILGVQFGDIAFVLTYGALFGDVWKFGFAVPVAVCVLAASAWFGRVACVAAAFALGVLNLALDYRSLGLVCLVLGAFASLQLFPRAWRLWIAPVGLVAGVALAGIVYQATRANNELRSNRSNLERSAMITAGLEAFAASPFIGQGSWFSRSQHVVDNFLLIREVEARLDHLGGFPDFQEEEDTMVIHSQLVVTLAEGGVFGAVFFIVYAAALGWALFNQVITSDWRWSSPLRYFVLCNALFNVFMSPFSGSHRVLIAMAAGLVVLVHHESREARRAPEAGEEPERDVTEAGVVQAESTLVRLRAGVAGGGA